MVSHIRPQRDYSKLTFRHLYPFHDWFPCFLHSCDCSLDELVPGMRQLRGNYPDRSAQVWRQRHFGKSLLGFGQMEWRWQGNGRYDFLGRW